MILTANLRIPSNPIHRDMARKSRCAKLLASLRMSTGSPLPLCGGEHGPEMPHREGGAAGASARCGSGGLGKSQSEPRPTSKEPATLSTAARLAFGSTSAWMSGAIDALACPRQLTAVLTSRPPAIIMVARVCLRSWNAQLRPFTLRRAERSLPSRAGLQGRPPRVPGVQGSPRATPVSCATRSASRRLAESVVSRCLVSAYPSALMSRIQEDTPSAERPASIISIK